MGIATKHILILTPGFPKDEKDTSCIPALQDFILELKESNPELLLSVISLQYPYEKSTYQWNGLNVFSCGGNNRKFPLRFLTWKKATTYFKALQQHPVDLIHSFWLTEAALLGNRWAKTHQIPHLCTLMGQDVQPDNRYLNRISLENLHPIAISKRQAELFAQTTGHQKPEIIPWGVKIPSSPNTSRDIDLFGAGNLISLKDYGTFVQIVKALLKDFPDLKAEIAGDGPEKDGLQRMIQKEGLENNLILLGQLSREEVLVKMSRSKVFLHPSNYESFGLVFSEALASGMRVISKAVGQASAGPAWKIGADQPELTDHCIQFLRREEIPKKPKNSLEENVEKYLSLYQKMIG